MKSKHIHVRPDASVGYTLIIAGQPETITDTLSHCRASHNLGRQSCCLCIHCGYYCP